ncbi:MAG: hypothetical protein RRC07_10785 [Anaerolineae bacterium]|nr:hypothetical protein [Anaerolineae bacterium]
MTGRFLRIVGIVLLGLTAVITLLSGIGTTCVALDATRYEGMESIADYRWLYLLYVAAGVIIGALGIRATALLVRGRRGSYRAALVALVLGAATGLLHMATSRALRGSSMPTDFVVYATAVTLAVFLVFRVPGIWKRVDLAGREEETGGLGAGIAMIVAALTTLTGQYWAGPSHSIGGMNYAGAWPALMAFAGWAMLLGGAGLLARWAAGRNSAAMVQLEGRLS